MGREIEGVSGGRGARGRETMSEKGDIGRLEISLEREGEETGITSMYDKKKEDSEGGLHMFSHQNRFKWL